MITSFLSLSKGSWLTITFILICFSFLKLRYTLKYIPLILFAFLIIDNNYGENIRWLLNVEITASEGAGSNYQRIATALSGFYIAFDYPFGIGTAYQEIVHQYVSQLNMRWIQPDPHNTLAHVSSVSGFGGLISYLGILFFAMLTIIQQEQYDKGISLT